MAQFTGDEVCFWAKILSEVTTAFKDRVDRFSFSAPFFQPGVGGGHLVQTWGCTRHSRHCVPDMHPLATVDHVNGDPRHHRLCNLDGTSKVENVCRAAFSRINWNVQIAEDSEWGRFYLWIPQERRDEIGACAAHFAV